MRASSDLMQECRSGAYRQRYTRSNGTQRIQILNLFGFPPSIKKTYWKEFLPDPNLWIDKRRGGKGGGKGGWGKRFSPDYERIFASHHRRMMMIVLVIVHIINIFYRITNLTSPFGVGVVKVIFYKYDSRLRCVVIFPLGKAKKKALDNSLSAQWTVKKKKGVDQVILHPPSCRFSFMMKLSHFSRVPTELPSRLCIHELRQKKGRKV